MDKKRLQKYAELVVKCGLNVQKGKPRINKNIMPINIVVPNILKGIPNKFNNANKTPAGTNNIALNKKIVGYLVKEKPIYAVFPYILLFAHLIISVVCGVVLSFVFRGTINIDADVNLKQI